MKKILAIDDQQDNLTTIKAVIKNYLPDCKVLTALSGKKGLEIALKDQPDTILLDIIMPDMDGYEVCKKLKKDESTKHIPVVMITAIKTDFESRIKGLNMGADAFLSKPIDPVELSAQINAMLRIKEAEDKLREEKGLVDQKVRKRTKELRESEEKFSLIGENTSDFISIVGLDGKYVYASPSYKLLGYDPDKLIGKNGFEILHPEDRKHMFPMIKQVILGFFKKGKIKRFEIRLRNKSGKYINAESIVKLITDNTGRFQILSVIRDITERKLTEMALKESEAKFRFLANNTLDTIWTTDLKFNLTYVNESILLFLGYTPEEFIGMNPSQFTTHEGLKKIGNLANEILSRGRQNIKKDNKVEVQQIRKDGQIIDVEISANLVINEDGENIGFQGRSIDITERKKAESKLQMERDKLIRILESMEDGVYIVNMNYDIQYINPVLKKDFGLPEGKKCYEYFHDSDEPCTFCKNKDVFDGKTVHWEWTSPRNGKTYDLIDTPIKNTDGSIHKLEIFRDISGLKLAEKKIKEALIKAEESDRLKSAFLANMSHEIRTPMNAIIGFSNLLSAAETEEQREEFINIVTSNGEHLLNIINDIIDISQIEAGIINIENKDCNINRILDEVLDIYITKDKIRNKKIEININKGLPDNKASILIDSLRLRQILINLLENAYKCTNKGEIECGYTLIQNKDNTDFLEFFVRDTGIGISKDKQKVIFNRFVQEDISSTRTIGGTGLGLTIAKAIVHVLGGDIWVESIPGQGSTFYFTIPYRIGALTEEIIESPVREKIDWNNKTILVAEDVEDSFYIIERMLIKTNVKIIRATNGFEAIEICRKDNMVDLVLMDIRMPIINGYEATIKIKKFRPDLPIIAQTAYAIVGDKEKAFEAGCDDYLSKPINQEILLEKIGRLLSG